MKKLLLAGRPVTGPSCFSAFSAARVSFVLEPAGEDFSAGSAAARFSQKFVCRNSTVAAAAPVAESSVKVLLGADPRH